jgi:hypothetical protein
VAFNPVEELVKSLIQLVAVGTPSPTVDLPDKISQIKQIQQVLVRPRKGNLEVGDQVAVLFLAQGLRQDSRFSTALELFHQQDPLPTLSESMAYFQRVSGRFEKPTQASPLAFPAAVFANPRPCFNMVRSGSCSRGATCHFSHDSRVVEEERARQDAVKHAKNAKIKADPKYAEFEAWKAAQAKVVPAGHVAQVDALALAELNGEVQRLRLLVEAAPVVGSYAARLGNFAELGLDHDLADMLASARDAL